MKTYNELLEEMRIEARKTWVEFGGWNNVVDAIMDVVLYESEACSGNDCPADTGAYHGECKGCPAMYPYDFTVRHAVQKYCRFEEENNE